MKKLVLYCLLLIVLSSCAHVISSENRENALSTVPLKEVRANVDQYAEKTFIFGGVIADTVSIEDGSELEVVQMPLDEWGYITRHDKSEGRFIVATKNHLDPLVFSKGREVTIAGVLAGMRTQKLGKRDYNYPLFRAKEIHLLAQPLYRDPYFGYGPFSYPYPYYGYGLPYYTYPNSSMFGPLYYYYH